MKFLDRQYLSTQFSNFANRVSEVFAKKQDIPQYTMSAINDTNGNGVVIQLSNSLSTTEIEKIFIPNNGNIKFTVDENGKIKTELVWLEIADE